MHNNKQQKFNHIATIIERWFAFMFAFLCLHYAAWSQEGLTITSHSENQIVIEYSLQNIISMPVDERHATLVTPAANSHSSETGHPILPQLRQLIAFNGGDIASVCIEQQAWDTVELGQLGSTLPLKPFGGANAKETMLPTAPIDNAYYTTDSLTGAQLLGIKPLGLMRGTPVAELTISPVRYNPASGSVALCRKLKATLSFADKSHESLNKYNPLLHTLPIAMPHGTKDYLNTLSEDSVPQVYTVVSATRYRETLQPLITWKRQEGYIVDEIYFDNGYNNDVKDSLQSRYDNASPSHPAPLFILLVGDMDQIYMWTPRHLIQGLETHRTDFYYAEFTGDMLPDAFIGRISVHDTAELRHVIEKTLLYEKGEIADTSTLRRSLLVAGYEETHPAPIVTNGQVNYLKELVMAHDPGHDTLCFHNPESNDKRDEILDVLREGVALMNYSAHCNSSGWRHPKLNNNDILNTDVVDSHLFIAVNNCCRSNDVAGECFGEQLLRKVGGGAVGVIGATNETLWDEDFYWSVGFGSLTLTPSPDSSSAGAFDRLLHPHNQPLCEQAWTMGQMLVAGNSAVTASGSQFADFYWEIYLLLGDPSLMPQIGPLHTIELQNDSVQLGDTLLTLHGTPWTRVAATCRDTLMGLCTLNANGDATMHFRQPVSSTITVTATRQFHKARQVTYHLTDDSSHVGIANMPSEEITIYPNPAYNQITIKGLAQPSRMRIIDIMGRQIIEERVTDGQTVDLRHLLPHGIYTLMVTSRDGKRVIKKIMIYD